MRASFCPTLLWALVSTQITNQFDLIGPEGRHNLCRGRQAPERTIQDSLAPKVATQHSRRGVCRRLRGSHDGFSDPGPEGPGNGCISPSGLSKVV